MFEAKIRNVFRLRNKETGEYWISGKGRSIFATKGALRGATKTTRWARVPEQNEIVEFELVEVGTEDL